MWIAIIRGIFELIGFIVVVWLIVITGEEYMKIKQREREENGQG